MVTQEIVREALKEVQDPELMLGIVELGLVYDVVVEGDAGQDVTVVMTLTSPMCPVGPMFTQSVQSKVEAIDGVDRCKVDLTFSPPWDPKTMASDDVKNQLGIW
jgi:metal-sulfur cluster biosynthetic enzyme